MYEPVHGSAPQIAGRGVANPLATVASAAMMLRLSLGEADAATALDAAVDEAIERGPRPADLGGTATTAQVTDFLLTALAAPAGVTA